MSQTMADALEDIYGKDSNMGKFSALLRKVDNAFDTFNSSCEGKAGQTKPLKCGYGKNLELQEETLVDFRAYVLQIMILNKANVRLLFPAPVLPQMPTFSSEPISILMPFSTKSNPSLYLVW